MGNSQSSCNCCKRGEEEQFIENNDESKMHESIQPGNSYVKQIGDSSIDKKFCSENLGYSQSNSQYQHEAGSHSGNDYTRPGSMTTSELTGNVNYTNNTLKTSDSQEFEIQGGQKAQPSLFQQQKSNENNANSATNSNQLTLQAQQALRDKKLKYSSQNQLPLEIVNEDHVREAGDEEANPSYDVEHAEDLEYIERRKIKTKVNDVNGNAGDSGQKPQNKVETFSHKIEEDSQEYENSPDAHRNNARRITNRRRSTVKDGYYTKLIKKTVNKEDILEAWKNISITSIIPESKLKSKDLDEIMFQGELLKLSPLQNSTNAYFNKYYSNKFLVFTKTELRYYKSKETFLTLQNPLQKIPCFQITHLTRANINAPIKGKKLHHLVVQLLAQEVSKSHIRDLEENLDHTSNSKAFRSEKSLTKVKDNDKRLEDIYTEILEHSMNEDVNKSGTEYQDNGRNSVRRSTDKRLSKKMILIDKEQQVEENRLSVYKTIRKIQQSEQINIFANNVLVFASESEDMVNKWMCVLDYFSSKI